MEGGLKAIFCHWMERPEAMVTILVCVGLALLLITPAYLGLRTWTRVRALYKHKLPGERGQRA
jgi:hypothetical protein